MEKRTIFLEKSESIGWLVLNQPEKRNAISQAMWEAIPFLLAEAENDKDILTVVIRGADEKAFAAGADISEFDSVHANASNSRSYNRTVHKAEHCLKTLSKPTIAMIQGPCIGGGCGLALACDLRFADLTARFAIPPSSLGLVYSLQGTKLLVDKVGPGFASDMIYSSRFIEAEEALRVGLIDRLFDSNKVKSETRNYCNTLSQKSQFTICSTKKIIQLILDGVTEDTKETLELFDSAFQGEDYYEGTRAFLEKRQPKFTWR